MSESGWNRRGKRAVQPILSQVGLERCQRIDKPVQRLTCCRHHSVCPSMVNFAIYPFPVLSVKFRALRWGTQETAAVHFLFALLQKGEVASVGPCLASCSVRPGSDHIRTTVEVQRISDNRKNIIISATLQFLTIFLLNWKLNVLHRGPHFKLFKMSGDIV